MTNPSFSHLSWHFFSTIKILGHQPSLIVSSTWKSYETRITLEQGFVLVTIQAHFRSPYLEIISPFLIQFGEGKVSHDPDSPSNHFSLEGTLENLDSPSLQVFFYCISFLFMYCTEAILIECFSPNNMWFLSLNKIITFYF